LWSSFVVESGREPSKAELDRALKLLIEQDRVTEVAQPTAGRSRTMYHA
jgi:hypothetical protein